MTEQEWLTSIDPAAMLRLLTRERVHAAGAGTVEVRREAQPSGRKLRLFATGCCRLVWDGTPCGECDGTGEYPYRNKTGVNHCPACHGSGKVGGLTDPRSRRAVEVAERFADGLATQSEMIAADSTGRQAYEWMGYVTESGPARLACCACNTAADLAAAYFVAGGVGSPPPATQASLLRDIFGNPFRPVTLREWVEFSLPGEQRRGEWRLSPWLTSNVQAIAAACYGGEPCKPIAPWCDNPKHIDRYYPCDEYEHDRRDCSGRTPFDPGRLVILADACEEAGCTDEALLMHLRGFELAKACGACADCCRSPGQCVSWAMPANDGWRGWRPLPTPHVRGCWSLDLILGKS